MGNMVYPRVIMKISKILLPLKEIQFLQDNIWYYLSITMEPYKSVQSLTNALMYVPGSIFSLISMYGDVASCIVLLSNITALLSMVQN